MIIYVNIHIDSTCINIPEAAAPMIRSFRMGGREQNPSLESRTSGNSQSHSVIAMQTQHVGNTRRIDKWIQIFYHLVRARLVAP